MSGDVVSKTIYHRPLSNSDRGVVAILPLILVVKTTVFSLIKCRQKKFTNTLRSS